MKIKFASLACLPTLLLLALPAPAAPQSHGLQVRAWIDGRSQLVLDGATAHWEHFDFAAPGRLECNLGAEVQPTFMEDDAWYPVWPDWPDCENRDCGGCSSSTYTRLHDPLPDAEYFPELQAVVGRGFCVLVEWPTAANGYRTVIEFNDNAFPGADWYEVHFTFQSCGVQRYCFATQNSTGKPAWMSLSGSLSTTLQDTVLEANDCPPGSMGVFLCGENKTQLPFANGMLCVSPSVHGLHVMDAPVLVSRTGSASVAVDFAKLPLDGRLADQLTWSFQFWFRDAAAGGAGANLSNALRVTFCP